MRIGLVSPYSLTVPGGVQAQVLGTRPRSCGAPGHEARVLGPCDGPPPESFVTPLGNSLPTAANGSMAPLAPDASATMRTIRALRDEAFRRAPRPRAAGSRSDDDHLLMHAAPRSSPRSTPPGRSSSYRIFWPLLSRMVRNIDVKVVVSKDALELVRSHLGGGDYEVLFNGVEHRHDPRRPRRWWRPNRRSSSAAATRSARASPCCSRRSPGCRRRPPVDRRRRPGHRRAAGAARRRRPHQWLGRINDAEKFGRLRGASVFCAPSLHGESFGVVLIEAMAAGTPVVASGLAGYRNVATDGVDALLVEPGDPEALAAALRRVLGDGALAGRLRAAGEERAAAVLDGTPRRRVRRRSTASSSHGVRSR